MAITNLDELEKIINSLTKNGNEEDVPFVEEVGVPSEGGKLSIRLTQVNREDPLGFMEPLPGYAVLYNRATGGDDGGSEFIAVKFENNTIGIAYVDSPAYHDEDCDAHACLDLFVLESEQAADKLAKKYIWHVS